jgi:hypothetical protein
LSLALPGAGQFYQGDHLRGGAYLGGTLALAGGIAAIQFPLFGMFPSGEQIAFATVQGLIISWVVMGGVSAFDAYQAILAKQPAVPVAAAALPAAAPSPSPTKPVPEAFDPAPTPAPKALPTVAPMADPIVEAPAVPNPEAIVLESYRLADTGDHWQAVTRLLTISDPAWQPKARALLASWSDAAGAQGLATARAQLKRGDRAAARAALDQLDKLPLKPNLRQQVSALRSELGARF